MKFEENGGIKDEGWVGKLGSGRNQGESWIKCRDDKT